MAMSTVGFVVKLTFYEQMLSMSFILLVRVREFEEVAAFLPQVEEAVSDVSKFSSVIFASSST